MKSRENVNKYKTAPHGAASYARAHRPVSKTGSLAHSGRDREAVARGPFGAPARVSERACLGNWAAER